MTAPRIPRIPRATGGPPSALARRMLFAVVAFIFVAPPIATRLADWLWYREVGFERVFLTMIVAQWVMGIAAGVGGFVLLYVSARVALRGVPTRNLHIKDAQAWAAEGPKVLLERMATWLAPLVCAGLALIAAMASAGYWKDLAAFFYRTPFGVVDPVFGRDVAYYVFTIPMLGNVLTFLWAMVSLAMVMAIAIYVARSDLGVAVGEQPQQWRLFVTPRAQLHLAVIGAAMLLMSAVRTLFVAVPDLLLGRHQALFGATYTDLQVQLPLLRFLAVAYLAAAVALVVYARRGQIVRGAGVVVLMVIAFGFLFGGVVPGMFQQFVVQPNELAKETTQIASHISATRAAWGLDAIERREFTTERPLTLRDVQNNQATIKNVRLWDREPLLQTYGQVQSIRTYYDFVSVDDDRYMIDGELRQVLLAPRELNTAALPTRTFVNEHLTYTHGMGVALGPSNQVTPEGLPVLLVKDLPPVSSVKGIEVKRPQIYFGEQSNDYILAPSGQKEFDYPSGEGDQAVYSSYDGGAGVSIGSFWARLLFAFRFGALNIMLSDQVNESTRIIFHRDVMDRAQRALPFLRFDPDPFMVITNDGRLVWMLDAYTTTTQYPYSLPLADGTNYMRNSVKVVIDAYTGEMRAYLAAPDDPMIRTLGRIYPGLLRPMSEMPADVRAHVRYPGALFGAQSQLYATYHMTNPETFYHREDQWQVPGGSQQRGQSPDAFMRHIVMRLPGERQPEFILMRPFTPRQKDNLAAWMVARNDGEQYGKLMVYSFPRQSLVFGPAQIVNRIEQDTEVSQQISLWDQRGSQVLRGELLVIPIEESLIYVQPLYLRAQGGKIPELKRVVVAHESRVAMAETLEAGLARLFGGAGASPAARSAEPAAPTGETAGAASTRLIREAQAAYDRARAALRSEDLATYGAEMKRLGEILRQLSAQSSRRQP